MADVAGFPAFTPLAGAAPSHKRRSVAAQMASLLATGGLLWAVSQAVLALPLPPAWFFVEALGCACLAWLSSAAIVIGLDMLIPRLEVEGLAQYAPRAAAVAVWFAPASILLARASPVALLAALVLVVNATRLLYPQWAEPGGADRANRASPLRESAEPIFDDALPSVPPLWRELALPVAAAFTLQSGAGAALLRYPLASGVLLAVFAAVLTALSLSAIPYQPARPRIRRGTATGAAATVLVAALIAAGGMAVQLWGSSEGAFGLGRSRSPGGEIGPLDGARAVLGELLYKDGRTASASRKPAELLPEAAIGPDGSYAGVILWPEVRAVPLLIAPLPAGGRSFAGSRNPLSIPFGGEYWMYRRPFSQPPPGSYLQRASPAKLVFRTTDRQPLEMEAHQKLEQSIDLDCCAAIAAIIRNADPKPGTVSLELILIDGGSRIVRTLNLGQQPVRSAPAGKDVAMEETLSFAVPSASSPRRFDALKVVFHRDPTRQDKSARIAIERFILIPRG